jgi:hypothetical protein
LELSNRLVANDKPPSVGHPSPTTGPLATQQIEAATQQPLPSLKVNAWAILLQLMQRFDDPVDANSLGSIRNDLTLVDAALRTLAIENNKEPSPANNEIDNHLRLLARQIGALRADGDGVDEALLGVASRNMKTTGADLQKFYEPAVLEQARALAERYRCPMHPDVIGRRSTLCPKCGMPLDTQVRLSLAVMPLVVSAASAKIIRAQVQTDTPLQVGAKTSAHLILTGPKREPIFPDQLREVHTQKIHLLIIDGSLTDYHHEHPVPTNVPGRYDFSFTPKKPGSYRVWADVQPYLTGIQEYAMTVVPADTPAEGLSDKAVKLGTIVNGLHYAIHFQQEVKSGEPAMGTLRVTQADGSGFTQLEPVMGAFAHLVGFHENRTTALHVHPETLRTPGPKDRGGPDLHFRLFAPLPGFFRLFVQVQRDGIQQFASFGLNVAPGSTPRADEKNNCSSMQISPTISDHGIRIAQTAYTNDAP